MSQGAILQAPTSRSLTWQIRRRLGTLGFYILLTSLLVPAFFPFYWMFISSLKTEAELFSLNPTLLPTTVSGEFYTRLLVKTAFLRYFANSLIVASLTMIMVVIVAVLAAYALARFRFHGSEFFALFLLIGQMFPSILLAIAIMATLGSALENVIIALSVVYAPNIARLVRSTTLMNKRQPYVESARAIGLRDSVILRRYIFLNSLSPLIVQCTFVVAFAILAESSLSYLGAGVPPGIPTWGNMVSDGQAQLQRAWWIAVFPGMFLFLTVLAVNLLGDGLRDALDPRVRKR